MFTLLGPSGCGKTTLLRMIAGFNDIDEGNIFVGDKRINDVPPHLRNTGMVFQNYAIFPHMSVFDNVAYGLKARKVPAAEIEKRVNEALDMVQISALKDRQPSNMSGGQQQRVALARAIVIHPDILLMDEPLSNLDAKLRVQMRNTIKKVQQKLGITTIYVTHDQEEALAISDRIAVMRLGEIQQIGKPRDIYSNPANTFVADFIGTSSFFSATLKDHTKGTITIEENLDLNVSIPLNSEQNQFLVSARPEEILLSDNSSDGIPGLISFKTFLGDHINYEVNIAENEKTIQVNQYITESHSEYQIGEKVKLSFNPNRINLYDKESLRSLNYD